jgi:hypothetical protein
LPCCLWCTAYDVKSEAADGTTAAAGELAAEKLQPEY